MNGLRVITYYGAKLDGHADDSDAWYRAINDMANNGGGTIIMPPGVSLVSSGIAMRNNVTIVGLSCRKSIIDCRGATTAVSVVGEQERAKQIRDGGLHRLKVLCGPSTVGMFLKFVRAPFRCSDLAIHGGGGPVGIHLDGFVHEATFENVRVDSVDVGVRLLRDDCVLASSNANKFRGLKTHSITNTCIEIDRSQINMFSDVNMEECNVTDCAIRIKGSGTKRYGSSNMFSNIRFGDAHDHPTGEYAIELEGCWANLFQGVMAQGLSIGVLRMQNAQMNMVDGLYFRTAQRGQLEIDTESKHNRIVGCYLSGYPLERFPDNTIIDLRACNE